MFRVLLVCTGNTCRSAIAEGLLKRQLAESAARAPEPRIEVSSAGTAAVDGLPASPEATEVCREVEADTSRHRSRRLTPGLLADSDLVLVMEEHQRQAAQQLHPGVAPRLFMLSEFAGEAAVAITDPIGGGMAVYRRTRGEIARLLRAALPRLAAMAQASGAGDSAPAANSARRSEGIEIGSDHRGFTLRRRMLRWLEERGLRVTDRGCEGPEPCDYPDVAYAVARAVAAHPGGLGVLICGSGIGMSMAANKVPGVRAALCVTPQMARLSRRHNDANLLALGADLVPPEENLRILEAWLEASFAGGRHARRVRKIMEGEVSGAAPGGAAPRGGGLSDG